jgi:hypothetical protein
MKISLHTVAALYAPATPASAQKPMTPSGYTLFLRHETLVLRIREIQGKCEGRKSYAECDLELVLAAKRQHRRPPKGHRVRLGW